ncbi:MAG: RHS repeat-associated core domain-containing protein, partial [bacterium]
TINLTDEKGSVTMTYAYDAFGAVTKEEDGVGWKKNDYKFVGAYGVQDDPASNLTYMRARYYDPQIGRFITKDPILQLIIAQNTPLQPMVGLNKRSLNFPSPTFILPFMLETPQGLHSYLYSLNNPVNLIDPYGLHGLPSDKLCVLIPDRKAKIICKILIWGMDWAFCQMAKKASDAREAKKKEWEEIFPECKDKTPYEPTKEEKDLLKQCKGKGYIK